MIQPKELFDAASERGVGLFVGVPDSLLASFCAYINDQVDSSKNLIAANEGNAVAIAMGYHMATRKVAMVYMQNSGLGNAVNPLTSLADPEVYSVPMVLLIGWRGEPGTKDEPQHIKQGRVTLGQLEVLEIPHWIIDGDTNIAATLDTVFEHMWKHSAPVALVVRKGAFSSYQPNVITHDKYSLAREDALQEMLKLIDEDDLVISTTGKTSREVFELREKNAQMQKDFLTVGGMGHTSSIALGVAIGKPNKRVICLDGDGSLLMHMGSMAVISKFNPKKFIHVLLNNESHESVGAQPTSADKIDFQKLSTAIGYKAYEVATDLVSLGSAWRRICKKDGPVLLEIKIKNGSREDLGRPSSTAEQNKQAFMRSAND